MAIDPTTDIVLDVIKAADPQRAAAATQRLYALGNGQAPAPSDFALALDQAMRSPTIGAAPMPSAADARSRLASVAAGGTDKAASVQEQFEAVLLNNFVGEMLPKNAGDVFGQGLSGDMWKSMLADQVSRQIAKSGALGIGKRLFASHPLTLPRAHEHAVAKAAGAPTAAQMSANALSLPSDIAPANGAVVFADSRTS